MKPQSKPWKCGSATVRNILRCFGKKVSEDTCSVLCGTTEEGTDEHGIIKALRHYNFHVVDFQTNSKQNGWSWLHGNLSNGYFVILAIENWEHWVACTGRCGDRITVVDPSNFKYNQQEYMTHVWDKPTLLAKWWNTRKNIDGQDRIYGIAVGKKKK